ncbi:MAG: zinc transporter [Lentimonas sp.]|jgi:zinc transporter
MNHNPGILLAHQIDNTGQGVALTDDAITNCVQAEDTLAWVHLDVNAPESREWLEQEVSHLDPIILDALLAGETRPRILEFEHGVLLILRGINLNKNAEPEDMISIRLWIDQSRIITLERRPLKAVADICERLESGRGPKTSGEFITTLSARLFERMEPIFSELDDRLDTIEEQVMDTPDAEHRPEITSIRKETIMYRRYIAPQRDVMAHLRTSEQSWLSQMDKRHLQESLDHVIRYIEDIDTMRERAQIIKDELTNALADKMNKNMYMLSVIAAIFLPLGFLTGLLGINIGGIPGSDNGNAFYLFCAILTGIITLQILLFKKLKWF